MNILNRYLLTKLSIAIGLILFTFVILILLVQILRFLDFVLEDGVSLWTLIALSLSMMPNLIIEIIPFAFMIGVVFTWNALSNNQELVIMQSCGLAPINLSKNIIYIGIFISCLMLWFAVYFTPFSYMKYLTLRAQISENFNLSSIETKKFIKINSGLTFYLDDKDGNTMHQVIIHSENYEKGPLTIFSQKAFAEQDGNNMVILLDKATIIQKNKENNTENILNLDKYIFSFQLTKQASEFDYSANEKLMSLWTLINYKNIPIVVALSQGNIQYNNIAKPYILEKNKRIINIFFPTMLSIIISYFFTSSSFKRTGNVKPISKSLFVAGVLKGINIGIIYSNPNETLIYTIFFLYFMLSIIILLRIYYPPNLKQINTNVFSYYLNDVYNRIINLIKKYSPLKG